MRLFAAIELPDEVLDAIADWWLQACAHLDPGQWREVRRENWHLTTAFYGDVDGKEIPDLTEALAECAAATEPIQLRLDGFGVFPRPSKPRVFWIGVDEDGDGRRLKRFARCCQRAGHATLRKRSAKQTPFVGHVTLARCRGDAGQGEVDWRLIPEPPEIVWQATSLTLFSSRLLPDGARYQRVEEFNFEEKADVR